MIKINELEAISLAASKDDTRYYLQGVLIETYKEGKQGMIATDGYRLASLYVQPAEEVSSSYILSSDDIKKALTIAKMEQKALAKSTADYVALTIATDDKASLTVNIGLFEKTGELVKILNSFTTKAIDGNFPDFRRAVPAAPKGDVYPIVSFNASYVADFGKMAKLLTGNKLPQINMTLRGKNEAMIINIPNAPEFAGVLVAMRE